MHRFKATSFASWACTLFLLVATMFASFAGPASAQDSKTWLPEFNPGQNVYIDPKLVNDSAAPVNFQGLETQIKAEMGLKGFDAYNTKVYVIATKQGSDFVAGTNMAKEKLAALQLKWAGNPSFDRANHLFIMWVRRADNPERGFVAASAGDTLRGLGFGTSYFDSDSKGPLTKNLFYMPKNPAGFALAVAKSVNDDAYAVYYESVKMYYYAAYFALFLVGLGILFLIIQFVRARSLLLKWESDLAKASQSYLVLNSEYSEFLEKKRTWLAKLKGDSLARYEQAMKDFAAFTVRFIKAQSVANEARDAFNHWRVFKTLALLTKRSVEVTGDDIPPEKRTLLGGLVEKTSYQPAKLLEALEALFTSTNSSLATTKNSFEAADKNKAEMDDLIAKVEAAQKPLEAASLPFGPYKSRLDALLQQREAVIAQMESDPEGANKASDVIEGKLVALASDLNRAVSLKSACDTVEVNLDAIQARVTESRANSFAYKYPLAEGESAPASIAQTRMTFVESGSNPDTAIADGRNLLVRARQALLAAALDETDSLSSQAQACRNTASSNIEKTAQAKLAVESKLVAQVRGLLSSLTSEVPAADRDLREIEDNFGRHVATHSTNMGDAENLTKGVTARVLKEVKELYDQQRFLEAESVLTDQTKVLNQARANLQAITARLNELRKKKADTETIISRCKTSLQTLSQKVQRTAFSTSAATAARFDAVKNAVDASAGASKARQPDWDELLAQAQAAEREIGEVDKQIDAEERARASANESISKLASTIRASNATAQDEYVLKAVRDTLNELTTTHANLNRRAQVARSDWKKLKEDADAAIAKAKSAGDLADSQIRSGREASSEISSAERQIRTVDGTNYSYNVQPDLSKARQKLSHAKTQLQNGEYTAAKETAEEASSAAQKADREAKAEVERKEEANRPPPVVIIGGGNLGGSVSGGSRHDDTSSYTPSHRDPDPTPISHSPDPAPFDNGVGGTEVKGDNGIGGKEY